MKQTIKFLLTATLCALIFSSCSVVFRSSIQGTIIDQEEYDKGNNIPITDAKVFIYTKEKSCDEDLKAFVEGDESTLPDSSTKEKFNYFQSTKTNANGEYSFTGFVWEAFFSEYGKTADRREIFLLIYHKNYGLIKNPVPLFVVSDVTNQLDTIKLTDALETSYINGKITKWDNNTNNEPLANVTVNFYIAKSWKYNGTDFVDVTYDENPTASTSSDSSGEWTTKLSFPMKPSRALNQKNAPVRISYVLNNYRANDNDSSTNLSDLNTSLVTNIDIDSNGKDPDHGDYSDAFILKTLTANETTDAGKIVLQRYQFSVPVSGKVSSETSGVGGVKVSLLLNSKTEAECSSSFNTNETGSISNEGSFNLGTITWKMNDMNVRDNKVTGEITAEIKLDYNNPSGGNITSLSPSDSPLILSLTK